MFMKSYRIFSDEKLSTESSHLFSWAGHFIICLKEGGSSAIEKLQPKESEDGAVKDGINGLKKEINATDHRTLGEYFASLSPEEERIRQRYTSRQMYIDEFNAIMDAQMSFNPTLVSEAGRKELFKKIFFQRKLKNQKHLVGNCELEKGKKKIAKAHLDFQEFRSLQTLNNLEISHKDTHEKIEISKEQRDELIDALNNNSKKEWLNKSGLLSFQNVSKILGLKHKQVEYNLSAIEKGIPGNKSACRIRGAIGEKWLKMSKSDKEQMVQDIVSYENSAGLYKRGKKHWNLDTETARDFSELTLESDYGRYSHRAINKLLPELRKGTHLQTILKDHYPERMKTDAEEFLKPVKEVLPHLANPIVERSLSQLRKIVNQLIKKYGKPSVIRIEMARAMKKGRRSRAETTKRNSANRKKREKARAEMVLRGAFGHENEIKNSDVEKYLLAMECNWTCPYTGKSIGSLTELLGSASAFDIEHIVPRSRSMDNSFFNKTLCCAEFNRNVKKQLTPYELFSGKPVEYEKVLQRVRHFSTGSDFGLKDQKIKRFEMKPEEVEESYENFCNRQLNDTSYISKAAGTYVSTLYGGKSDSDGKLRVQVSAGQLTSLLRNVWNLNKILGSQRKSRDNHRHHAIDAFVVAAANRNIVNQVSKSFKMGNRHKPDYEHMAGNLCVPFEDVRKAILDFNVSHDVSNKVNGPIHEETLYGKPKKVFDGKKERTVVHVRKPLPSLNGEKGIMQIVDPVVRDLVLDKFKKLGGKKCDVFNTYENLPRMKTTNGTPGPVIRKVKVLSAAKPDTLSSSEKERFVKLGNNHHIEIYAELDDKGNETKWCGKVVSLLEAMNRKRKKLPIVNREHGENASFKFSLTQGNAIELTKEKLKEIFIIRGISQRKNGSLVIDYVRADDARLKKDIISSNDWGCIQSLQKMKKLGALKMTMSPLGESYRSNA